jgi:hypothetical protein
MNKKNFSFFIKITLIGNILLFPVESLAAKQYYLYLQNFSMESVQIQFNYTGAITPTPASLMLGVPGSGMDTRMVVLSGGNSTWQYNDIVANYTMGIYSGSFKLHVNMYQDSDKHCLSYTVDSSTGGKNISITSSQNDHIYHIENVFVHFCDGQDTNCIHEKAFVDATFC